MISNSSNDPKDMWKILRNILPSKSISDRIPENLTADSFNSYFTQIGNKLTSSNFGPQVDMPNLPHVSANSCFVLSHIPVSFVEDYLLRLPDNPSLDVLNIACKLLSIAAPYISMSLTHLFNLTILNCQLPDDSKIARVSPIYKGKGTIDDPGNYRPISVVSIITKLLESAIKTQLMNYLITHDIISNSQFAYMKHRSTQSALHVPVDDFLDNINNNMINGSVQLDLQKGFYFIT